MVRNLTSSWFLLNIRHSSAKNIWILRKSSIVMRGYRLITVPVISHSVQLKTVATVSNGDRNCGACSLFTINAKFVIIYPENQKFVKVVRLSSVMIVSCLTKMWLQNVQNVTRRLKLYTLKCQVEKRTCPLSAL